MSTPMKKIILKKYLHRKYNWFECRFSPLDAYEEIISCRWCGKSYKRNGLPYIGGMTLTPLDK